MIDLVPQGKYKGYPKSLVPVFERQKANSADKLAKGGYIIRDASDGAPDMILIATGSEVEIALNAASILQDKGLSARVVSMPSWELFEKQPSAYKEQVLPPHIEKRVSIEAGVTAGWERYVGAKGIALGLDHFGASAPYKTLYEKFGLTAERVVEAALGITV